MLILTGVMALMYAKLLYCVNTMSDGALSGRPRGSLSGQRLYNMQCIIPAWLLLVPFIIGTDHRLNKELRCIT